MGIEEILDKPIAHENHWNQSDVMLITYGDSIENRQSSEPAIIGFQTFRNLNGFFKPLLQTLIGVCIYCHSIHTVRRYLVMDYSDNQIGATLVRSLMNSD